MYIDIVDIDRVIEVLKNCTNETDRQIAKWLEKLKYIENIILKWNADWYNDEDTGIPDNEILETIFNACIDNGLDIPIDEDYREGYNKAIDDLSNILKENYDYLPQILSQKAFDGYIDEYAEQLKAGGTSGTDNQ